MTPTVASLAAMTGQNKSVLMTTPAVHHRADGYAGATPMAIMEAHKPRRSRRAHMSMALSDLPGWISVPSGPEEVSAREDLHTPFGLYPLLHELTSRSRELTGTDRLPIGWSSSGAGVGRGLRQQSTDRWVFRWARGHGLTADKPDAEGNPLPLTVTPDLLQLTYVELHQKPVAHTEQTLVTDYLARNRGKRPSRASPSPTAPISTRRPPSASMAGSGESTASPSTRLPGSPAC
ncbi:hypothetical protein [Streptomyces sp. IBSBF 2806]|uniref:hypothetical protein n=1 Tax=Streptomyces sp. IBSBF 2806 TaxID=2903529 RepID=UPI002FDBD6E7